MRKVVILIVLILSVFLNINAQLLTEDFNYSDGAVLTANNWVQLGSTATNPISVGTSNGLTYSGYDGSGVGNAAIMANTGQDISRSLSSTVSSGSFYVSFMVNVSAVGSTSGDYFLHVSPSTTNTSNFYMKVWAKKDGSGNLLFGVSKANSTSSNATFASSTYSMGTTYLLVVKYTFNTGSTTDDAVSLWINPALDGNEPTANVVNATDASADPTAAIGALNLRQGSSSAAPTLVIDGIRVSTSWSGIPLPVELTSFTAAVKGKNVELAWKTATETQNAGFEIERKQILLNSPLQGGNSEGVGGFSKIGFVEGAGSSNTPKAYSYVDASASGKVQYRLKQIDRDGSFHYSNIVEANVNVIPNEYALMQNHPNPFNPTTVINYQLPVTSNVTLRVFNILGEEVASLVNGMQTAGEHTAQFDASKLNSGVYFYTIQTPQFTKTMKMLLVVLFGSFGTTQTTFE